MYRQLILKLNTRDRRNHHVTKYHSGGNMVDIGDSPLCHIELCFFHSAYMFYRLQYL